MKIHLLLICDLAILAICFCQGCAKETKNSLYRGTFMEGQDSNCPNTIVITESIPGGIPVNQSISFFDDLVAESGDVLTFQILEYSLDSSIHTLDCVWGKYIGTIQLQK